MTWRVWWMWPYKNTWYGECDEKDTTKTHEECNECYHHHHQSLNRKGHWSTTDDFATNFLHFSLFSTALWDFPNSRPVHFLMLSSHLFLSALSSSPFHCALQDDFGQTWWAGDMTIPLQFASFYDRQEIFVWSNCLLDLGTDFLVGNMVFVWDV